MISGGNFKIAEQVVRGGDEKWRLFHERKSERYPPFIGGEGGQVIARAVAVAEYFSSKSEELLNYQGEGVSLGIWADGAPMDVFRFKDKRLSNAKRVVDL